MIRALTSIVKIPEQLEDAYLHHKNEVLREVKGDVLHMTTSFHFKILIGENQELVKRV